MKTSNHIRRCDGCTFCCWAYNVAVPLKGSMIQKKELNHCPHECEKGCALHNKKAQPKICGEYKCPYLTGEKIHHPKEFQNTLWGMNISMGNFIPAISDRISIPKTIRKIIELRTIPAYIYLNGAWALTIIPLDKNPDGSWATTIEMAMEWVTFYKQNGIKFPYKIDQPQNIQI